MPIYRCMPDPITHTRSRGNNARCGVPKPKHFAPKDRPLTVSCMRCIKLMFRGKGTFQREDY